MRSLSYLSLVAVVLALGSQPVRAEIRSDGTDTSKNVGPQTEEPTGPCQVLWFGVQSPSELDRLRALGLTITQTTNPSDLTLANLSTNYNVLVIAYTGPSVIGGQQGGIQAYVNGGGGLLIHQPNALGTIDYAPAAFDATITDIFWCNSAATIVNGAHAITAGLTDADLSGGFDRVGAIGAGYTLLAREIGCSEPALAAGSSGSGRVVFETGNASPLSLDPGSDLYWTRVFDWLCLAGVTATRPATWGAVKASYR